MKYFKVLRPPKKKHTRNLCNNEEVKSSANAIVINTNSREVKSRIEKSTAVI
jgi:hypothetical protein